MVTDVVPVEDIAIDIPIGLQIATEVHSECQINPSRRNVTKEPEPIIIIAPTYGWPS